MTTNEFERDLNDQAGLKRPGRVDFRVFQNTADAGDGHPGVQRCFRNYLHEGGMEKDLDLIAHGIKGTSVDINNVELQQLSNIGITTISGTQWGYLGELDQPLKQADSPTFGGLTVNGNITITGNVDSVDISTFKSDYDTHKASTGADHTYIDQSVIITASPTFNGLTVNGNIVITGTVDGIDISDFKTDYDIKINQNLKTNDSPTFVGLTLSANLITTSTVDGVDVSTFKTTYDTHAANTSNPHTVTLDQAFAAGHIISGADISNKFEVGTSSGYRISIYTAGGNMYLVPAVSLRLGGTGADVLAYSSNSQNLGNASYPWKEVVHCGLSAQTCADFSHLTSDEIYSIISQFKPRESVYEEMKDGSLLPHIDMSSVPDLLADISQEDHELPNLKNIDGENVTLHYKKGEKCGIDFENLVYMIKDLLVNSYEKIKVLEKEIEVLKQN